MRIGIRNKILLSFLAMLALPVLAVLVTGYGGADHWELLNIIPIILSLLIPFYICAVVLVGIIKSSILKPLKELNLATQKIMGGDYDFDISYRKNNEMGDFCLAFDLMKIKLKESMQKQMALEESRKELIASISHDLRTPMTSIKGYVEALQDGIIHDKEKFNRYIKVIKNKTESLDNLIENLFQFSQIEIGNQPMDLCLRNCKDMLEEILNPIEVEFADLTIAFVIERPFPSAYVNVNTGNISQVFDNLISNAKRYIAKDGEIKVGAHIENDSLIVTIKDDGAGIAEKDLQHVFDYFYRADKSRSRNFGGAGLGLSICRKIIEKHNGNIWVVSKPNIGTVFSFSLPLNKTTFL